MGQAPKISLNISIQTLWKLKISNIYFNVSFFMKQFWIACNFAIIIQDLSALYFDAVMEILTEALLKLQVLFVLVFISVYYCVWNFAS